MICAISRLFGFRGKGRSVKATPVSRFRPWLERLEERDVPAIAFWIGDSMVDLNWSTDANWLDGFKPGADDAAVFDENAVADCVIDSDVSVAELYMWKGFDNRTITLTNTDVDLTVTKSLFMNAGQIAGGDLTVSGGTFEWWGGTRQGNNAYNDITTISANAVLKIRGNVALANSTLNNYGTIDIHYIDNPAPNNNSAPMGASNLETTGDVARIDRVDPVEPAIEFEFKMLADARLVNKDGSFFNNLAGLQNEMEIHSDASFTEFAIDPGATFTHSKSFLSIETSLFNSAGGLKLYDNSGMVVFGEGTLAGTVSLETDSNFFINPYGKLNFILENVRVTGAGVLGYADSRYGSSLEIKGSNTIQNFVQSGGYGNITGDGTLKISGTFDWIGGGAWTGKVNVNIQANAVLNIIEGEGGTTFYFWNGSTLSNFGTVNWDSGSIVSGSDNGSNTPSTRIYNAEGAVFDVQGDLTLTSQFEPLAFVNDGTVMKSQGDGVASIDLIFVSTGTLETTSGTLAFNESIL